MNPQPIRALVVEDDRSWQQILSEILSDCGLQVDVVSNINDAIASLKAFPHRVAVLDLSLSPNDHANNDGLRVLDIVHRLDPNCQAILLTGFATVELAVSTLTDYGAYTFLRKENFSRGQFREIIYRVLATAPQVHTHQNLPSGLTSGNQSVSKLQISSPQTDLSSGRAIIVEDDAGWRNILEELLIDSGYRVQACISYGEALGYLNRDKFSLAVVDLSLSGNIDSLWNQKLSPENLEGYQLLASTRKSGIPTIIVSGIASTDDIRRIYAEQSIFAFLEKQSFDRAAFRKIVSDAKMSLEENSELTILTEREREVLDLLAKGLTNKEIAERLFITTNTVKRHLKAVFDKLDVHTRSAAAAKALSEK